MAPLRQQLLWRYYLIEVLDHWPYIAFGVVLGAAVVWWYTRPPDLLDGAAVATCRRSYGLAKSQADTSKVDASYPRASWILSMIHVATGETLPAVETRRCYAERSGLKP
jgi:hypothetical protein